MLFNNALQNKSEVVKMLELLPLAGLYSAGVVCISKFIVDGLINKPTVYEEVGTLNKLFQLIDLKNKDQTYVTVKEVIPHDHFKIIRLNIPLGVSHEQVNNATSHIITHYKNDCTLIYEEYDCYFKLYTTKLKDQYAYTTVPTTKKGVSVCLGMSREGAYIYSFTDEYPAILIGGTTGAGKSNLVNAILCNLIENRKDIEMALLDMKGNELNEYEPCQQTIYHTTEPKEAVAYFSVILNEVKMRYKKMGSCRSIESYNAKHPNDPIKYRVIVLEEMMSLLDLKKEYVNKLATVLSKCRACGIYFLLTTQRPTDDVVSSLLGANIGMRIGLKTSKERESINLIERKGLERISVKGRGKFVKDGEMVTLQPFFISEEQIARITQKNARTDAVDSKTMNYKGQNKKPSKTLKTAKKDVLENEWLL